MENRKKVLGIKNSIIRSIHKIILIAILHSTFVAPSQTLINDYINFVEPLRYNGGTTLPASSVNEKQMFPNSNPVANVTNNILKNNLLDTNYSISADIPNGLIGATEDNPLDDAADNLFKFNIENLPVTNSKVFLTYELYGVQDANAVSRSINDQPATGGYIIKEQQGWSIQKEEINMQSLTLGENKILFNTPKGSNYQYQVKNVKLEFSEQNIQPSTSLVINAPAVNYIKDNKLYIKGFLRNYGADVKIVADKTPLVFSQGEFEGVVNLTPQIKNQNFIVVSAYDAKGILGQEIIMLDNLVEADKSYEIEKPFELISQFIKAKSTAEIKYEGTTLQINDSALTDNKQISVSKLRSVDIAPLNSGMINVTKGGNGFRFMPDGTKFEKNVQLEIEYDENRIPKGHKVSEIKTFYFNTSSKNWVAIERDSINEQNKTVLSSTNHFSDYINGIIQTPESPETAGFAPTAMNDIKAVDPSSEMTIITPPEVSQKGDANINYPIKIPAGRNGMQPNLAISYNSDGGNSWLGQGWNIQTPSITIDTRWGVPTFVSNEESEIYMMNGEQLMYPKVNGEDWMPNRHYGSGNVILTDPITRKPNIQFTPRKQGSFTRIERVGSATTNYVWKVTDTNGTINWYGGKTVPVANAVIKDATGNIVHWALYLSQDIHGNSIHYTYTNNTLSGQTGQNANLNGGIIFNIKNIQYVGYNDADYKYEVSFNSTTAIRQDVNINARLGVKQIEPYFLDNIVVKKVGTLAFIRKYTLETGYGKFNKGRLNKITELDKNDKEFYKHTFDYYNDLGETGSEVYFSDGEVQDICNDAAPTPCRDSDGDTVCDNVDQCPKQAGDPKNFGCPIITNCFNAGIINNDVMQATDFSVAVDNVVLVGSPFATFNDFKAAFQNQHPVSRFDFFTDGFSITINPTSRQYTDIKFYKDIKSQYTVPFIDCSAMRINSSSVANSNKYENYFSDLMSNNQFENSALIPNPCSLFSNPDFIIPGIFTSFDSSASVLGSSKSEAYSAGASIGIGIGNKRLTKMSTFGYQWSRGKDKSFGMTALIDINGDGLEDIVSKDGSSLYYKKHLLTRTYDANNNPVITHSFATKQPISGINNFYRSFGKNKNRNFQITFGGGRLGGFVGLNKSTSSSETDMYFTDGNGDGLMDVVRDGVVYFNRLDSNGNPNFIPDSQGSENLVITAKAATIEIPDVETQEDIVIPAFDVIKVWEAPADGTIKIDNTIVLTDTSKEAIATIEIKPAQPIPTKCYSVSFPAPKFSTYTYTNNTHPSFGTHDNKCVKLKLVAYNLNGTPYATPNLYFCNGDINGSRYRCLLTRNDLNGYEYPNGFSGVQSPDFIPRNTDLLNQVFTNIPNSSYTVPLFNAVQYYQPNGNPSYFSNRVIYNLKYLSPNANASITISTKWSASNNNSYSEIQNHSTRTSADSGIVTNISINGTPLTSNSYNLYNDSSQFRMAIQNKYPGSSVTVDNQNIYTVSINNTNEVLNTITLAPVNGSAAKTYNFIEKPCNKTITKSDNEIADMQNDWEAYVPSKEEMEMAYTKYVAEGKEIEEPIQPTNYMYEIDATGNNIDPNLSGPYSISIEGNKKEWFNIDGILITDDYTINILNQLLPVSFVQDYEEFEQTNRINELENRNSAQIAAQNWMDDYNARQQALNPPQDINYNTTTCDSSPSPISLLYGTILKNGNSTVVKMIDLNSSGGALLVNKGDRIYFRVHSVTNGNPPVNWDPKVEYTTPGYSTIIDANGNKPFSSAYSDGFVLSGKLPTMFPGKSGTAKVTWTPFTITPTDKVVYQIVKETVSNDANDNPSSTTSTSIVFEQICNPNVASTISPTVALNNITVAEESTSPGIFSQNLFYFRVISTSNVDWKNSVWKPEIEFKTTTSVSPNPDGSSPEGNLTSITKEYPVPDYDLYRLFPCGTTFIKSDISSLAGRPGLRIQPSLSGVNFSGDNGKINFVVKRGNVWKGTRVFTITNGSLSVNDPTPILLGTTGDSTLEIIYSSDDSESDINTSVLMKKMALTSSTLAIISYNGANINVPKNQITLYQKNDAKFGSFYRQWGQFMYRPDMVVGALSSGIGNTKLIKEEALVVSISQSQANHLNTDLGGVNDSMTEDQLGAFETSHQDYLNSIVFLPATAERKLENNELIDKWIGFHSENYASEFAYRAEKLEESVIDVEEGSANIEQGVVYTGAYAISKYSKGISNKNFSGGISVSGTGPVSGGANGSFSKDGYNNMLSDYVDRNGDRYPDIETSKKTQYTNQTGGLYVPVTQPDQSISTSTSDTKGFGASGSYSKNNDSKGDGTSTGSGFQRFDGFKGNSGAGFSGSFQNGKSETQKLWTDINGDGLSDLIETGANGSNVILNFGPKTANTVVNNWGSLPLFNSTSNGISGGLGFNKWKGSVEAGVALTTSWNSATNTLADINGDGLLDLIYPDSDFTVKLNVGNQFIASKKWSNYNLNRESATVGASINAGVTFALIWRFWALSFKIPAVNISGTPLSTSTNKTKKSITDFDGDGYADLLEEIGGNKVRVYHSRIRRTDKLKSVTSPLGGVFTIDYKLQPVDYNNPNAKWAMSSIVIEDKCDKVNDGIDKYNKEFVYENGRYDRREREFYGYKTVKVIDYKTGQTTPYRTSVSTYNNISYFVNGMMEESFTMKGSDVTKIFSKTKNFYDVFALNDSNDKIINPLSPLAPLYDVGGSEGRRTACVLVTKTRNEIYELSATPIVSEMLMQYDEKGRIIEYNNIGNIAESIDDYKSIITYHTTLDLLNIINVPKSIKVNVGATTMRERATEVNLTTGKIIKTSAKNGSRWLDTTMQYDIYGNLTQIIYPKNTANQSMSYTYEYDPITFSKYVTKITDAFGYTTSTTYNSDFDKVVKNTDMTGNFIEYFYDDFSRSTSILGPKERGIKPYTIKFEYYPYLGLLPSGSATAANFTPIAVTSHYDPQNPTNDIQTYNFIDGLGRPIQVKKDIAVNTGTVASPTITEQLSVSGKTTYDEFGRAIAQYHPSFETIANNKKFIVNEDNVAYFSTMEYDELDRPIKNTDPELSTSKMEYTIGTIGGRTALKTKSIAQQSGAQDIVSESYNDIKGNTIFTQNNSATGNLVTKFIFNNISELMSYSDAANLTTTYKYDMLGRKIEMIHPDSGKTTYAYDDVNLVSVQTPNLQPTNKFIKYTHQRNRIAAITYPATASGGANVNNVTYQYGAVASGNETGRLICLQDATGVQTMKYGSMGEMITNTRTIVGPNIPTREFITQFVYDSWNRIQNITYPDGEKVIYKYDLGGNLNKMTGKIVNTNYNYIQRIEYDYYGQKTYMKYANGAETFYKYTAKLRRLDNLNVKTADLVNLYDNNYGYDKIGNVTSIKNLAPFTSNNMAGAYNHSFVYDDLNRLSKASGNFTGSTAQPIGNDRSSTYTLEMAYDATNALKSKKQQHNKNGSLFVPNTYNNTYTPFSGKHQVQKVTGATAAELTEFKYDANGNTIERKDRQERTMYSWDEANRLKAVVNNTTLQHSVYDANGERVLKADAPIVLPFTNGSPINGFVPTIVEDYTVYPSPFMTIAQGGIYTKHYYAGSQRIVSRVAESNANIFEVTCTSCKACIQPMPVADLKAAQRSELKLFAQDSGLLNIVFRSYVMLNLDILEIEAGNFVPTVKPIYFYHPDHIGTSTALTDYNGKAYQFFLNLPFGETMAEQLGSNYYNTPYKFNGKELDSETGLYYYGARYYEPKFSNWLSVDPLAEKYGSMSPYTYCANNPIIHTDPTGRSVDGEFEKDNNGEWQKTSDIGDDIGVDFYHTDEVGKDGVFRQNTYVTDRKGNWNVISNGRNNINNYEKRYLNVDWTTIYDEWNNGTGPEESIFEGDHPANGWIKHNDNFLEAYSKFLSSGKPKLRLGIKFGLTDVLLTPEGDNQAQMMGSYNVSFYKLGNKTLCLGTDTKSRSSFYLHLPWISNYSRGSAKTSSTIDIKETTTYQTYLFFF